MGVDPDDSDSTDAFDAVFDAVTSGSFLPLARPLAARLLRALSATRRLVRATNAEIRDAALSRVPPIERAQLRAAEQISELVVETQGVRTARFVRELAHEMWEGRVDAEDAASQAGFREAVLVNFRRAMEVADPCVLPVLARLTLVSAADPLDRFARGLGRVLVDLAPSELDLLRRLGEGLGQLAAASPPEGRLVLRTRTTSDGRRPELWADALHGGGTRTLFGWTAEGAALLHALIVQGILEPPVGEEPGYSSEAFFAALESHSIGGGRVAEARHADALRLGAVLRAGAAR